MNTRDYNKIYVNTDREEGSEKITLGYQNSERELILYKDEETFFHIPFFSETVKLKDTTLIQSGATAGPYPAASDRIFKNKKNYGNVTPNGNPSDIADGVWFCSWLYKDEYGNSQWMDRYYNPGTLFLPLAYSQLTESRVYKKNNPVYRDVPSTMVLESGVQYRYFHVGEKKANELVCTFTGSVSGNGPNLLLNLDNWGNENVDSSINSHKVYINTTSDYNSLYSLSAEKDRVFGNTINFNHKNDLSVFVNYDSSYTPTTEFSLSFWCYNKDWMSSPSTQLVGNYSSNGGYGIFIDTLSSYPYFVIPETKGDTKNGGHLLYVNNKMLSFKDIRMPSNESPQLIGIDLDHNVIVCTFNNSIIKIQKYDNVGKLLHWASKKINDYPLQLICGPDDTVLIITNSARYQYDRTLSLISESPWQNSANSVSAYKYYKNGNCELISVENVCDCKYIETTQWSISSTSSLTISGDLCKDGNLHNKIDNATNLAIDPYDRIWVLHGNNDVSVYSSNSEPDSAPLFKINLGENIKYDQKTIGFICLYDKNANMKEWRSVVYYSKLYTDDPKEQTPSTSQIYITDLNGILIESIDILSLFDSKRLASSTSNFQFFSKGDFTGYEHRRVFTKLPPYNNKPQLIIKTALKDKLKQVPNLTTFKSYATIDEWTSNSWQHIFLTLQNRTFSLYRNGNILTTLSYTGRHELSYELQPSFFVGSPVGSQAGFNNEIKCSSSIFNGAFEAIKIYNYAIDAKNLELFLRATMSAQNIYWSSPTPPIQYIEKIERMFKNKIPGAKSSFFKIKLCGTQITDKQTQQIIEQELRNIIANVTPAHTNFLGIHWVD